MRSSPSTPLDASAASASAATRSRFGASSKAGIAIVTSIGRSLRAGSSPVRHPSDWYFRRLAHQMRVVGFAAIAAVGLALGYAVLVSPGFEPFLDDQVSYLRLAHGLVERGEYTRAALGAPFAPEPLRPPGCPLFLVPFCLFGCSHWAIAIGQALLYGALVLFAYGLARAMLPARQAQIAAVLVAFFLPLAYFAAIAYSDFLAAFLLAAGLPAFLPARRTSSVLWAVAPGAVLGWLPVLRPPFVLFSA